MKFFNLFTALHRCPVRQQAHVNSKAREFAQGVGKQLDKQSREGKELTNELRKLEASLSTAFPANKK